MLYTYFEFFDPQNSRQTTTTLRAQLKIVDAKTGKLEIDFEPVDAAPYVKAGSSIVRIARGIHLNSLQAGEYQLQVRATGSSGTYSDWHTATFVRR
jgi:hypothetical protein